MCRSSLHNLLGAIFLSCMQFHCVFEQGVISHAHNDYEKPLPLWNALQHDFGSIEIDIARLDSSLIVTHTLDSLYFKPTLEELYFEPLVSYLDTATTSLWLLVDLKRFDYQTLDLLHEIVSKNEHLFLRRSDPEGSKPLQIILSGSMPRREIMNSAKYIYFFIDGRIEHLGQGYATSSMPLISANFSQISTWNGVGEMSETDQQLLRSIVDRVIGENKKLRFWKTVDSEIVWEALIALGVHVIGTDEVERLDLFLQMRGK